ncbi:MAG: carbon storage regulator [Patescibacteria group bacterium]|nr:carbon storage regulator [Patescibacteria group bacterium]
MITIPRKKGESIVIGDSIILTIVDIDDDEVRISIEHPPEMTVERLDALEPRALEPRALEPLATLQ